MYATVGVEGACGTDDGVEAFGVVRGMVGRGLLGVVGGDVVKGTEDSRGLRLVGGRKLVMLGKGKGVEGAGGARKVGLARFDVMLVIGAVGEL